MPGTYRIDDFRKKYPHLAREILDGEGGQSIELTVDMGYSDPWSGYVPTVIDYIRRCKSVSEALEVIDYLVKHEELSTRDAEELRTLLREKGLEFFGGRKQDDYYYKEARRYWEKAFENT
ncbi:DUF2095 family protein [Desulfurococcus mucosus]|uniref:DUF2095 domain-containing protein n=1 Tax=Desulfurococcus mucosus (strain ATCC 35584 / DSM 2162 / JCM 9187 / O7/1) TaxID=765177 RepID=E8R7F3_DESM0|nr:DUF2095 family protein [Desulfurococcus mucosus]ADV65618.1 Protein of unknown function DUF2095 [Desulfurococcus mucosus DSM 2162]